MNSLNFEEKTKRAELPHHLILEGRGRLSVSGVEDVDSFDDNHIIMLTTKGTLVVKGNDLRVDKLSIDSGELNIEGVVDSLSYEDQPQTSGSFWAHLFR